MQHLFICLLVHTQRVFSHCCSLESISAQNQVNAIMLLFFFLSACWEAKSQSSPKLAWIGSGTAFVRGCMHVFLSKSTFFRRRKYTSNAKCQHTVHAIPQDCKPIVYGIIILSLSLCLIIFSLSLYVQPLELNCLPSTLFPFNFK